MARSGNIKITLGSQSITNNTSTFTVEGIITTTNGTYRGDHRTGTYKIMQGGTVVKSGTFTHGAPANATTTLFSVSATVGHDAEGKSGLITAEYSYDEGWCTASGSLDLPRIARKSSLTISNGTLGVAQSWKITAQGSFTHKIRYNTGSLSGYILGSKTATSTTISDDSWKPPLDWAFPEPVKNAINVEFVLETYSGSTLIGSTPYTRTFAIPDTVVPAVSVRHSDYDGYDNTYGGYIQNVSRASVHIDAEGLYGADIVSYSTKINGKTYSGAEFVTDTLTKSGTLNCTATVTDSRERSTTVEFKLTVLAYSAPVLSKVSVARDSTGNRLVVKFNSKITALNNKNTAKYTVQYKAKTATAYGTEVEVTTYTGNYAVSGGTYSFAADSATTYDVQLIAADIFNSTSTVLTGPTISVFSSRWKKGLGVAWGKVAEIAEAFDVGWKAIFRKSVTIHDYIEADTSASGKGVKFTNAGTDAQTVGLVGGTSEQRPLFAYDWTNNRVIWAYDADGNLRILRPAIISNDLTLSGGTLQMGGNKIKFSGDAAKVIQFTNCGTTDTTVFLQALGLSSSNIIGLYDYTKEAYVWRYAASGNFGVDVPLWVGGTVTATESVRTDSDLKSGGKDNYVDGKTGVCVVASGNIHAQHATAPSLRFYVAEGTTADNGRIYMNSDDYMYFSRASRYTFDQQIFSTTSTIGTSDRKKKKDFKAFDERYEGLFFDLKPQVFKFKDGTSNRYHSGFISNDVEESLFANGLESTDFAGFCKEQQRKIVIDTDEEYREELVFDENGDPVYDYMLRYEEFIALNTHMLQKAYERIRNQDEEIESIKTKAIEQEDRIAKLESILQQAGLM